MPWKPPPQPKCARCEKSVYPTEQLKCLDKLWHKACFNCEVCHTKLTMATYRGFDKKPYCRTHYPEGKATQVAETPETLRLKKQTERQSVVQYQKQYQEDKGHYVGSATDKSMEAARRAGSIASDVKYKQEPPKPVQQAAVPAPQQQAPPPQPEQQEQQPEPVVQQQQQQPEPVATTTAPAASGEKWVAQFDYEAADSDEVSFSEGDIIIDVEIIDDGWAKGTVERTGATGMLPSNYIEKSSGDSAAPQQQPEPEPEQQPEPEPEPEPEQPAAPQATGEKWVAQYDYEAADSDEVSFNEGDLIIDVEIIDEGWAQGTVERTGERGMLPSNYIEKQ